MNGTSRAFEWWLGERGDTLAVPLLFAARTAVSFRFHLSGVIRVIEVFAMPNQISVGVEHEGQRWDLLVSFDCAPRAIASGYVCSISNDCVEEVYPSLDEFWRDRLFEPLAR